MRRSLALVLSVHIVLAPASASAQRANGAAASSEAAEAKKRASDLKKRGDERLDARRYAEALADYDAAFALDPQPALAYNRGRALQFLGRYPEALEAIEKFAAEASPELLARVPGLPKLREELRARVGTIVIRADVSGARVLVDQRQVGVTPFAAPLKVNAGRVVVDAFAEGAFPFHRELDVPGGATIEVPLALVSRESNGLVRVRSRVEDARVTIDDRFLGVAPAEATLSAGTHRVLVQSTGHDDATTQLVVRAGETKELWLDPASRPPVYARWWFWTGVAAVVAAGTVTAIALTTEKSPPSGDYSPGLVRF